MTRIPPKEMYPDLSEEALDKVRTLIGTWLRRDVHVAAKYEPVSLHDIRRWAHYSVGDDNPLWSDVEYAKQTRWACNIAPPTFLYTIDSGIIAPGLRGVQWIFAGGRWENHFPVRVGDTVTARARLISVDVKSGRAAPRFVKQTGEVIFENQLSQIVSRYEGDIFRIPRARSGKGLRYTRNPNPEPYRYTDAEIEEIAAAYRNEIRRGSKSRYWEDVNIGEEIPTVYKGPLTLVDIVGFYAGRRNVYNVLKMAFAERDRHRHNVYVSPSTNIPMHPAAGHYDAEIAREIGMPGAYDQGWQRMNWGAHLITNWAGDNGFVRYFSGRVILPNLVGDLTRLSGKVTAKVKRGDEALIDVAWWGTN